MSELSDSVNNLVPSTDPTVREGYKAIYTTTAQRFMTAEVGQVELLLSLTGTNLGANSIAIQAALQHPFRYETRCLLKQNLLNIEYTVKVAYTSPATTPSTILPSTLNTSLIQPMFRFFVKVSNLPGSSAKHSQ